MEMMEFTWEGDAEQPYVTLEKWALCEIIYLSLHFHKGDFYLQCSVQTTVEMHCGKTHLLKLLMTSSMKLGQKVFLLLASSLVFIICWWPQNNYYYSHIKAAKQFSIHSQFPRQMWHCASTELDNIIWIKSPELN